MHQLERDHVMIRNMNHYYHQGLNALSKGLARVLPRSGSRKQTGSSGAHLAVFSAFATLSLLFTPNATLAQDAPANLTASFGESTYTAIENGAAAMVTVNLDQPADRTVRIEISATRPATTEAGDYTVSATYVVFLEDEESRTITVTAHDDSDTDNETVRLGFGSLPTGVGAGGPSSTTVTLRDDDLKPLTVAFSLPTSNATENGSNATVTVTLTPAADRTVRIPILTHNAASGGPPAPATNPAVAADYSLSAEEVIFTPGQSSKSITVTAKADIDHDNENVALGFGTLPAEVTSTAAIHMVHTVTLDDDDKWVVSFDAAKYTANEGANNTDGTAVTVPVTLAPASLAAGQTRTITITVSPAEGDFELVGLPENKQLVFDSSNSSYNLDVTAKGDADALDEKVTLSITDLPPTVRTGSYATTVVTLADSSPQSVSFVDSEYYATENGTVARVDVELVRPSDKEVTVPITATNQGSTVNADYELSAEKVVFAVGQTRQAITVTAKADNDEREDSVQLALGTPTPANANVSLGGQQTTLVTLREDQRSTVVFGAKTYTATEEGLDATVEVRLSSAPAAASSLRITTNPGSGDFTLSGGTGQFDATTKRIALDTSTTSYTFTVKAEPDADTMNEEVTLGFASLPTSFRTGSTATTTVTLKDATQPKVSFGEGGYTAIENGTPVSVDITLEPPSDKTVTIAITATPTSPTVEDDFKLSAREVVFEAGDTRKRISVVASLDADTDHDKVELGFDTLPGDVTSGLHATTTVTLADDGNRVVSIAATDATAAEDSADDATVTVTLMGAAPTGTQKVTIPIIVMPATGDFTLAGSDLTNKSTVEFGFADFSSGSASKTITVIAEADDDTENDKVTFSFGALPAGVAADTAMATATVTLQDATQPEVSFGETGYTAIENDAAATVDVMLGAPLDKEVTIEITTTPASGDFTLSAKKVVFAAGDTRQTITVTAQADVDTIDDSVDLGFKTPLPKGVTAGAPPTTTVTLFDDNVLGKSTATFSFSVGTDSIATEGGAPATVTVTLAPAPASGSVTIPFTTTPETGDFVLSSPGLLTIDSTGTGTFTVAAIDDSDVELDEKVKVAFGALPENTIPGSSVDVTLRDNDRLALTISFGADRTAEEGGDPAMVEVKLNKVADRTLKIPITLTGDTDVAETDLPKDGKLVFMNGDKTKMITVTALYDADATDQAVTLGFGTALPDGVTGTDTAAVTLEDADSNPLFVSFAGATYAAIEEGISAMLMVKVTTDAAGSTPRTTGNAARDLMIPITTDPKTGPFMLEGVTGEMGNYMLAIGKKSSSATITVLATEDGNVLDDIVTLGFDAKTLPGVAQGTQATAAVTLVDDMQFSSTVSFDIAEYTATEGGDAATVMVKLDPALPSGSRQTVTIPISGEPMAGAELGDFMLSATEVTFAGSEMYKTITVTAVNNDVAVASDGAVKLIFGALPEGITAGDVAETTVTLADDDRNENIVAYFMPGAATAAEGDEAGAMVSVGLDLGEGVETLDREITLQISVNHSEGAEGDYTVSTMSAAFAAGSAAADLWVPITVTANLDDDNDDETVTLGLVSLPLGVAAGDTAEQPATAVVTLEDDMLKTLTVSFEMATYEAIEEGDPVMVTVMLNEATDRDLTIPITTDPDMGPFTLSSMEVMFIEGEGESKMIEVTATDDMDVDNDMVTLMFGELPARVNAGDRATTEVTLVDDMRVALMVSFEMTSYTATEGGDATSVIVSLSEASDRDITVPIIANPAEGDFILSHTEVMFAADDISMTITVKATDDDDVEDDMLELSIGALPADVSKGAQSTTMVTLEDDGLAALVVSFEMASYTAMEAGADAMVKVMLNVASDRDVTVPIIANPAEGDFDLDVTEVVFAEGDQEMLITVTALVDDDVEDEMLELSLGELPLKVTAGDQATTMVTLEDKGFTVVFAQARYSIKESDRGTVTANISPSAIGQIEVPLSVAHQGGATANDYSGVPGSLVFVGGSNQATFTVSVMADEENDPGESIDVSFGNLPDKVNAGDLAMTTVEFEQFRTAEQFSRTLQAALAVVAGSMGDSAISAIETRFERYRESMGSGGSSALRNSEPTYGHWSDMESQGLAISGYQGAGGMDDGFAPMATKTPGTGLTTGFSRGYRNLTSGSLSDNISLGALASTARPGESAIASGYGGVSGANREQDVSFSGVAFEMAMEHGDEGKFSPVVWVQGDMQSFDGNLENIGMDFDGGLNALHLGVDLYANGQTLAGVSMMQSWGDLDYTDDGVDGNFDSSMSTFHPYIYFQANENLGVWGILGFGSGSVDMSEPDRTHEFDADFSMFAGGVRSVLNRRDNNELGLSADAFTAELSTNAADDIPGVKGEAQRARVMVDWLQNKTMEEGQQLAWKAEIGGRFDGGDGIEGVGIEGGFRVGLLDNNSGLDLALTGRALLLHENDFSDWGIGVQATWDPGEKREGLVASVASSFGQDRGGSTSLWDNGDTIMRPVGMDAMWMDSQYRMDGEVGYAGIRTPLGLPGTVMPYSRARWSGYGQEFGVGTRWMPAASENNLLPATFELEGLSRETRTGLTDLAVLLRMSIPFGGSKAIVPSRNHVSARQVSAATGPTIQPVSSSRQDANSTSESTKAE